MRLLLALATLALLTAAPARAASDDFVVAAESSGDPGWIGLGVIAPAHLEEVTLSEQFGDRTVEIGTVTLKPFGDAAPGLAYGFVRRAAQWRCDRLTRHFNASARDGQFKLFSTGTFNRTPSCRNRLELKIPPRVRRGQPLRIGIRDTFRAGDVDGELCLATPGGRRERCRPIDLASGQKRQVARTTPRVRGRWRVTVRTHEQHTRRTVSVGVPAARPIPTVLATGDSQMQSLDALLADRLTGRALVRSDVHNGSGLVQDEPVDWELLPEEQAAGGVPTATVIALGANDSGSMVTEDGAEVRCCGELWRDEYQRRVAATMLTYVADGGSVFWLTIPAARDERRHAPNEAANAAVAEAARQVRRAHVLDVAALLTPGGEYRGSLRGRDVRARDGVHLSIAGAAIAARAIDRALQAAGLVPGHDRR